MDHRRIQSPVRRERASHYLLLTLLSFAASVSITRLFLYLTGYPQIGSGELHIAHVLWGGLILFVATLFPLLYANRWALSVSAILSGIGVGLFIDEVGKFITSNNNYFFPAAAPIIYAFFLLAVLLYTRVKRPPGQDARSELYRVLDELDEALDSDLDAEERAVLSEHLNQIIHTQTDPNLKRLAEELDHFATSSQLVLAPHRPDFWQRWKVRLVAFENRHLARRRYRTLLAILLLLLGIWQLTLPLRLTFLMHSLPHLQQTLASMAGSQLVQGSISLSAFEVRLALDGTIGILLVAGSIFLILGYDKRGAWLGYLGLLMTLTVANLLVFYFEQFSTIINALIQLIVLLGLMRYRRKYLLPFHSDEH